MTACPEGLDQVTGPVPSCTVGGFYKVSMSGFVSKGGGTPNAEGRCGHVSEQCGL